MVALINYNDHAPPHLHIKYQGDVRNYRIEIVSRRWLRPGKALPGGLSDLIETWIAAHEEALLEQWENARSGRPVVIVG